MIRQLELGDVSVDVQFKDIKNIHLSVYPPTGRVRISAPEHMSLDTVRVFAISKLAWIRAQQKKLVSQEREAPREFLERESHYLWGERYLLELKTCKGAAHVTATHKKLIISSASPVSQERLNSIMDEFYRQTLRIKALEFISNWETRLGVQVNQLFIQRMKTKWGSCNPVARNVRINLDLAKKAPECLEYIILHELLHLILPNHGPRFVELMDQYMPHWRIVRERLNTAPLTNLEGTPQPLCRT